MNLFACQCQICILLDAYKQKRYIWRMHYLFKTNLASVLNPSVKLPSSYSILWDYCISLCNVILYSFYWKLCHRTTLNQFSSYIWVQEKVINSFPLVTDVLCIFIYKYLRSISLMEISRKLYKDILFVQN